MRYWTILAALSAGFTAPAVAQVSDAEAVVADPARDEAARALDEGRQPAQILAFADVQPGDVVADYYAGDGYFSTLLAAMTGPQGRVYAMNPASFTNADVWKANRERFPQAVLLNAEADAMALAPASVDMIFSHLVYHDLYWESERFGLPRLDVDRILSNWFAAVKPGGHVVIVDHYGPEGDTRVVVDKLHRIDRAVAIADMERAGFVLVEGSDMLQRNKDDLSLNVFDPAIRGNTSRFSLKFKRP